VAKKAEKRPDFVASSEKAKSHVASEVIRPRLARFLVLLQEEPDPKD
jgi:hypothetical protein